MDLKIITPERIILDAEVEAVYAYGLEGRFGILPKHTPMVSLLSIGVLCYFIGGVRHCAAIIGGVLKTDGQQVVVLSEAAELGEEVDVLRAQQARKRAEEQLQAKAKETGVDVGKAELALARALTRLKAAHRL